MATTATTPELVPWKDSYKVGIKSIDAQHQGLIRIINELHAAMANGRGRQEIGKTIDQLVEYTKVHFSTEEKLLQAHGYPELAAHQVQHQKLTQQVIDFQREIKAGNLTLSVNVMGFLRPWLIEHILGTDFKYRLHLSSHGVS